MQALEAVPDPDEQTYVQHAREKLWIADFARHQLTQSLSDADHAAAPWGFTTAVNAYLFCCIGELASALDNLAFVVNRRMQLGVADHRVDFPFLASNPSLATWRQGHVGQLSALSTRTRG